MDRSSVTRDELLAEVESLRRSLARMEEVEARSRRAEEALKALEERIVALEAEIRALVRGYLEPLGTVEQDRIGSLICSQGQSGPRVMLAGHTPARHRFNLNVEYRMLSERPIQHSLFIIHHSRLYPFLTRQAT